MSEHGGVNGGLGAGSGTGSGAGASAGSGTGLGAGGDSQVRSDSGSRRGRHAAGGSAGATGVAGVTTVEGVIADAELTRLLEAFEGYEAALMSNDLDALDRYFAAGPGTMRGDAAGLLVGHDRISAFRGLRGGLPPRRIVEVHVRVVDPGTALIMSVSAPVKGGRGLQTQLWQQRDGVWVISAAHVAAPAPAINPTIWRVVGAPLVPPLAPQPVVSSAAGAEPVDGVSGEGRPLEGMTVAVKDLFDVGGFAVGAGIPEFLAGASVATADSDAVRALRAAGAAVQGIAQTDEFAYSIAGRNIHYGTPPNPAVPGAIPGGSSSGPASAVALGQATIGLATDTAGSIRVPASYQGLWGIRTTHGAVSARGVHPLAVSFDTVGWIARSAVVLRAAATASFEGAPGEGWEAMPDAPADTESATETETESATETETVTPGADGGAGSGGTRFVVASELVAGCDGDVQEAFAAVVDAIRASGAYGAVDEVELGGLEEVFAAFRTVQGAEAWRADGEWITAHPGELAPDVAERFEVASAITAEQESAARAVLAEARARFDAVLAGRILVLPSASSAAPRLDAPPETIATVRAATLRMTSVAGTGGYPAVSAPLMTVPSAGGSAPVGLCLVGGRGTDLALIDVAAELAERLGS
ncbi:AtzH-like domain-containing protein [Herbiconiux solani]|uniref:AtzH-like domain-containing protein n=1 Tax=Herbiconiux solani TaxID=661329 RepID=UPI0009FD917B|nr:AtzH-like domain-containing protein [Herbiconiux solani]